MAELKNGLLNGGSGKIGNLITYQRNGKYFVRSRPEKVKQPNSVAQLAARQRFSLVHSVLSKLKEVLRYGFATDGTERPAYSAAVSYNLKQATAGTYPNQYIDYSCLGIFYGKRALPEQIQMEYSDKILCISWLHNASSSYYANDRASLVLLSADKKWMDYRLDAAKRKEGLLEIKTDIPKGGMHVYLSFYANIPIAGTTKMEEVCPSFYCGFLEE